METSKDFEEFFELLNKYQVRYLLVGGYAFAVHAEPRYTKELDIFFDREEGNANRMLSVLNEFGFSSSEIQSKDLMKPERIIQLGTPPLRIDLLASIDAVSFSDAWPNRMEATYGNESIYVIGKEDLIKNKRAAARDQDLLDVKRLRK